MEAINLLSGYANKLKAVEKQLKQLERKSETLSQKQAETDEQRIYLEAKVLDHQRDTAALLSERQDLQLRYMSAVYEQDVSAQRDVQARRQEIDHLLKQHTAAIEELRTSLDGLPTFTEEAATIAAQLDGLNFGNGFAFAMQLRDVLVRNETTLKSRQSEARKELPSFTEAQRRQVDTAYREQREREEARLAKAEAQRRDDEAKAKVTNKVVRDDEGIVIGVRSFDEEGNFVKYTEAKMVSGKR
jgi:hypothetical protein